MVKIYFMLLAIVVFVVAGLFCFRCNRRFKLVRREYLRKIETAGLLAGSAAHDFNNIVTGIRGAAEKILLKNKDAAEVTKYAETILKACDCSSYLTSKLLFCARNDNRFREKININDCVKEAASLLRDSVSETIQVMTRIEAGKTYVYGNRSLLESALLNLGFNARDVLENRGGKIEMATRNVFLNQADIKKCLIRVAAGNFLEVSVSDNGGGISDKIMQKLFEPFFTTKPEGKGTGLGLPAVYAVVLEYGGTLRIVTSAAGSCFYLYFPLAEEADVSAGECLADGKINARVLVVDDDRVLRELLSDILQSFGVEVFAAATPEEAEKIYCTSRNIDVVWLDVAMPEGNGIDVYERLKKVNPDVKVIFMSGYGQDGRLAELLKQDERADFIHKPYASSDCYNKLVGMLAKK